MTDTPQKMTYEEAKEVFDQLWQKNMQLHAEKEKEKRFLGKIDECDKAIDAVEARYRIYHDAKEYREDVHEEEQERAGFSAQLCEVRKIMQELEPQIEHLKKQLCSMQPATEVSPQQTETSVCTKPQQPVLTLFDSDKF